MKKRFIFDIVVVIFLFLLAVPLTKCWVASAAENNFPDISFSSNYSEAESGLLIQQFYDNSSVIAKGFTQSNSIVCIVYDPGMYVFNVCAIRGDFATYHDSQFFYRQVAYPCSSIIISRSDNDNYIYAYHISSISNYDFSTNYTGSSSNDFACINYSPSFNNILFFPSVLSSTQSYLISGNPFSFSKYLFNNSYIPPFEPTVLYGYPVGLEFSDADFAQWIIDNNKLSYLPSYITASKLGSFVDFYKTFGSSQSSFFQNISDWFHHYNIASQTSENISLLKSGIDRLYQEYVNSHRVYIAWGNTANAVHHRNSINTKTDDSDTTLITDDVNDDVITSILRDILRGVIAIPNSIYNGSSAIIAKLDSLDFTVSISNNGGVPSGTDINPLLQKLDDIIEALQADTVSVDIDQTTQDDTDQFFDDWNLEFKTALDSKFPVAGQLSTLFTDFWEKCGVDVDNDGETFEYYNPGSLEARSEVRSLSSAGTSESDIVSDFLDQFDDSDPAFLDDASFNSVPDLSVSIGGSDVSIFDFRVYAKYRDKIHFIISLVIWSLYLLHLYKALPTIIGQVADVAVKVTDD